MAKKTQVKVETSFKLGDHVRIKDMAGKVGRIAELRGPLGPGGASVYRVKVQKKPRASYIELLDNQIEAVPIVTKVKAARSSAVVIKPARARAGPTTLQTGKAKAQPPK